LVVLGAAVLLPRTASAQASGLAGTVRDETGASLPGVAVELSAASGVRQTTTDQQGAYRFDGLDRGPARLTFILVNFATVRRDLHLPASGTLHSDAVLQLALNADVTITGKATFTNLADVENPWENLVGIAQSASQGAVTARQLDTRPMLRTGEVLESVPGVVISQHSGEGKANQYYLRGFNLDHGTDFATTVAGVPVNLPAHGHGHGYSDLNFLIPELVSGVQFSKGPYFAEQGDFATAGAASINYANALGRPLLRVTAGGQGFGRVLAAASPPVGRHRLLGALELQRNDGPWERPDRFRKVNAVVRLSAGDALNGYSVTAMGYRGTWHSTDQIPERALAQGVIGRLGTLDPTSGGDTSRYSAALEWQRTRANATTRVGAFGLAYDLDLFSNFTYFLDDPVNGDQFRQVDRRVVSGARVSHRRLGRWADRAVQNTVGAQVRHDAIGRVGLYRTVARRVLATVREDAVQQTSVAAFVQNETVWSPWLRSLAGLRADGYRFDVDAGVPINSGTAFAGLLSPKGGLVVGPWQGTEVYLNGGLGFHSNDARGATIAVDPATGAPAERVTPLARARGAEIGVRSVRIPKVQLSLSLWTLRLDSELVFIGDAGTTEAGRPSRRQGVELAAYYSPRPWLTLDGDLALSHARFTDDDPAGALVPGAVGTVVSAGATLDSLKRLFGSVRWRYVGPRDLIEDGSKRSAVSSLVNVEAGYRLSARTRIALDVFNLLDAKRSDIDYFYASRLPGEPASGVDDLHFHPTAPRTARLSLIVGF
jgi:hypothetical protein